LFSSKDKLSGYLDEDYSENCMEAEEGRRLTNGRATELFCKIGKSKSLSGATEYYRSKLKT
jgi:hypothetical protein